MILKSSLAVLAASLALSACSQPTGENSQRATGGTTSPATSVAPGSSAPSSPTPSPQVATGRPDGVNDGYPDLTPVPVTEEVRSKEEGARAVLLPFARAIELREFDQAWSMMDENGRSQWSKARFNKMFEGLNRITVAIPSGRMEGAAGSSYYTSDATVTATDKAGRPIVIEGPIVLKRVNDVPGATPEQLEWHVYSANLEWTH